MNEEGSRGLDARSEIFSFGAVLYELLSGRRAFQSLAAVLRDQPPSLNTSEPLKAIVERCLQKDPARRFSIRQLLEPEKARSKPPPA